MLNMVEQVEHVEQREWENVSTHQHYKNESLHYIIINDATLNMHAIACFVAVAVAP